MKTAPLVIVVGFLGAGKTTLLRDLLPALESRGLAPFVIINDYQNARVDAASLNAPGRTVAPINGNCVCCDSVMELMVTLVEVPEAENRVVLIEANGTTDPTALIEHLLVNPRLRERYAPLLQVTVVDTKRWQKRHWHNELEHLQVETSSHLFFTRLDSETPERIAEVRADIKFFNPRAEAVELNALADLFEKSAKNPQHPAEHHEHEHEHAHGDAHSHDNERHSLSHAFVGVQLDLPTPISSTMLQEWLHGLPSSVLRVKGLVQLTDAHNDWFTFQRVDASQTGTALMKLPQTPIVPSCAVLIGVKLNAVALADQLRRALEPAVGGSLA